MHALEGSSPGRATASVQGPASVTAGAYFDVSWKGPGNTYDHISIAAKDAAILSPLYLKLREKIALAGLERVAEIERRCLPAMVWMRMAGVGFDWDGWRELAEATKTEALCIEERMNALAPAPPPPERPRAGVRR